MELKIKTDRWTRIEEVCEYAEMYDLYLHEAIEQLVNKGLSHL